MCILIGEVSEMEKATMDACPWMYVNSVDYYFRLLYRLVGLRITTLYSFDGLTVFM